jgi:hypothetical protein
MNRGLLRLLLVLVVASFLSACADKNAVVLGPQQWKNLTFKIETRPSPLRVGMNEFIVIANRDGDKIGVDLVIMMRVGERGEWRQAIQDGFSGVYRRAVQVDDPATQSLHVHVHRTKDEDETMLIFPLNQKPAVS